MLERQLITAMLAASLCLQIPCANAQDFQVSGRKSTDPLSDTYEGYVAQFKKAVASGLTIDSLNQILQNYSQFVLPAMDTNELRNALEGKETQRFALRQLKSEPFFKSGIEKLIHSSNVNNRIFAYITVGSTAERSFNDVLLKAIKTEDEKGARIWSGMSLLYLQDKHTSELFDFLVKNEEFGDAHMIPFYMRLDRNAVMQTAYEKISSNDKNAKILAVQSLSVTDLNPKTEQIVKDAVRNWDPELKGYAIYTLKELHIGGLKSVLQPIIDSANGKDRSLHRIALEALANSSSAEDQQYLSSLIPANSEVPDDILNAYLDSDKPENTKKWLLLVREKTISPKYYFSAVVNHPLLASDEVVEDVRTTIEKTVNRKVIAELCRALKGRNDEKSVSLLVRLLSDTDSTVRYWAASSLNSNKSTQLVSILPELIRNPDLRTVALTKLAIENNIDGLQDVYESFLAPESKSSLDWRRSAGEYLAHFPRKQDREYFRSVLQSKQDSFIKRNAALSLGKLHDTDSLDLIIAAMKEEPPFDQNAAVYLMALGQIKGEKAKQIIESYKNSKVDSVRALATKLLQDW